MKEKFRDVTSEGIQANYDKYTRGSNPVKYFVKNAIERDAKVSMSTVDMHDWFEFFCHTEGLSPGSESFLRRKLIDEGFEKPRKTRINGIKFTLGEVSERLTGDTGRGIRRKTKPWIP